MNATALEIILRITKNLYIFVELMMIDVIYRQVKSCSSSFISDTFGLLLDLVYNKMTINCVNNSSLIYFTMFTTGIASQENDLIIQVCC